MNFNDYQDATAATAIYPGAGTGSASALSYVALGLANEAGEAAGKVKKLLRDGHLDIDAVGKEIGDVLWYAARLAAELSIPLEAIASGNIDKLKDRKDRGVLGGSGDNR